METGSRTMLSRRSWKKITSMYLDDRGTIEKGIDLFRRVKRALIG